MNCRVTYRKNGGVSVTPISEATMEEFEVHYAKLLTNHMYADSTYEDMDMTDLPPRDENRDKWTKNPKGGIKINK
jgi:hypothetical protein